MPVRPENRDRYPADWAAPLAEMLSADDLDAVEHLRRSIGFDPATSPAFWENLLACRLGGQTTPASHPSDVDMGHFEIEVKFSQPSWMRLGPLARRYRVFRWTGLTGHGNRPKTAEVTILIGLDDDRAVHAWVLPRVAINGTNTATVVIPAAARGRSRSALDGYYVPIFDLLDAVLCHLHYDREHHAQTAARTRAAALGAGMDPLFPLAAEQVPL